MKLTVLGRYGCAPCKDGACSSYLVESEGAKVLLDCGSGALSRLQNYCKIEDLDAIVLSHLHSDHISDMFPLRYYLDLVRKKVPVYLPFLNLPEFDMLSQCKHMHLIKLEDGGKVEVGDLSLSFSKVFHSVECYATRIECGGRVLVYSGDTAFDEGLASCVSGAHTFLADCAIPSEVHGSKYSHMSVSQGVELAKAADCRLIITHIFGGMSPSAEASELYSNSCVAVEGRTYDI